MADQCKLIAFQCKYLAKTLARKLEAVQKEFKGRDPYGDDKAMVTALSELSRLQEKLEVAAHRQDAAFRSAKAVQCALSHQLEQFHTKASGEDLVKLTVDDEGSKHSRLLARSLVRTWSPPFEALVRHGNGLEFNEPAEIELGDATPKVLNEAVDFMILGKLPKTAQSRATIVANNMHPLLEFADRYDLCALKESYTDALLVHTPLEVVNAGGYLNLAVNYKVPDLERRASSMLVSGDHPSFQSEFTKQFLQLSCDAARVVLAKDELKVGHSDFQFKESEVLQLVRKWVQVKPDTRRTESLELMQSVRLGLFGFHELTELECGLDADSELSLHVAWLRPAILEAIEEKLRAHASTVSEGTSRKRSLTKVMEGADEERACKMARTLLRLVVRK